MVRGSAERGLAAANGGRHATDAGGRGIDRRLLARWLRDGARGGRYGRNRTSASVNSWTATSDVGYDAAIVVAATATVTKRHARADRGAPAGRSSSKRAMRDVTSPPPISVLIGSAAGVACGISRTIFTSADARAHRL